MVGARQPQKDAAGPFVASVVSVFVTFAFAAVAGYDRGAILEEGHELITPFPTRCRSRSTHCTTTVL